jgi:hypothetical protein
MKEIRDSVGGALALSALLGLVTFVSWCQSKIPFNLLRLERRWKLQFRQLLVGPGENQGWSIPEVKELWFRIAIGVIRFSVLGEPQAVNI